MWEYRYHILVNRAGCCCSITQCRSCTKADLKVYDDRDEQCQDGKEEHQVKGIQRNLEHLINILTFGLISDGFGVMAEEGFEDQSNNIIQDGTTKPSTQRGNEVGGRTPR